MGHLHTLWEARLELLPELDLAQVGVDLKQRHPDLLLVTLLVVVGLLVDQVLQLLEVLDPLDQHLLPHTLHERALVEVLVLGQQPPVVHLGEGLLLVQLL